MDPLTQGVLGATAAQALAQLLSKPQNPGQTSPVKSDPSYLIRVGIVGAVAGMSADLDVLIRSSSDPLLFLEYHRQFTHSLIFIPIGALIVAVLFPLLLKLIRKKSWGFSFSQYYLFSLLGYSTHALLDACTTYGTMLYWPFSDARVAWNVIAVIDPIYTLPLLIAVLLAGRLNKAWIVRLALIWVFLYPSLGAYQRDRVETLAKVKVTDELGEVLAQETKQGAKPSMANIWLWKVITETKTHYYVDAVSLGLFQQESEAKFYRGDKIAKLNLARDFPWLDASSRQARDIERFRWFSNGFVAKDPDYSDRIIDIRYSMLPNEIRPIWSIVLNLHAAGDDHVKYLTHRDASKQKRKKYFEMLFD